MTRSYSPTLVILSLLVASVASYVALDLAGRVTAARGRARALWLTGGALAMGIGIWSMHFVGMLAFRLDVMPMHAGGGATTRVPMTYDMPLMLLSVLVAVLASGLALAVVGRRASVGAGRWVAAGLVMGGAICGMHYIGMASMRLPAALTYRPSLVVASALVAVLASYAALGLAFRLRQESGGAAVAPRLGAALLMGLAIAGMHYTAMGAALFAPLREGMLPVASGAVLATNGLAGIVIAGTLVILALALLGAALDRWLGERLRLAGEQERLYHAAEAARRQAEVARRDAELARAEAERRGAEAAAANRAKTDLLRTMSHELRTPLNAIGGYVQLLEMELRGPLTESQREDLGRIMRAQRHLLALVNDVLDFARIERGAITYERTRVTLARVLEDVHALLAAEVEAKGLAFEREVPYDAVASADAERVRQILVNIIDNGIKFTPRGGRIAVTCATEGGHALLRLTDTGIGVPPDKLEAIFQPFVQVSTGLTREAEGVGLGLAISRELARAMDGDLTASSAPGLGTTFTLRLPAA